MYYEVKIAKGYVTYIVPAEVVKELERYLTDKGINFTTVMKPEEPSKIVLPPDFKG